MDSNWVGNQIATLRKNKGLTGDRLSEILGVTPQAVSKWENGKCLPETSILIKLAQTLGVTIDRLLVERELTILKAMFTDGVNSTDVTSILNQFMIGNSLNLYISAEGLGVKQQSDRLSLILIEYQISSNVYYTYCLENSFLSLDKDTKGMQYLRDKELQVAAAYFGPKDNYHDCLAKIELYNFCQFQEVYVNDQSFPSPPSIDEMGYLTLVYLNSKGIHAISAAENETLVYKKGRTELSIKDMSSYILPGVKPLHWEQGRECSWAGAITEALNYMGESYRYEQIMGISGACYRVAFLDMWDWSAQDALVGFDFSHVLFEGIGYEVSWSNYLEKYERKRERERIINDILHNKPVIAINLRIANEWGIITGYAEKGKKLYCRTYFDGKMQNEQEEYMECDFWPFLIQHFEHKKEKPSPKHILMASLEAMVGSFKAPCRNGYYQGIEGYEHWISGLRNEKLWSDESLPLDIEHRLEVNDYLLFSLADARRCAGEYLKECTTLLPKEDAVLLHEIADYYILAGQRVTEFREKLVHSTGKVLTYNHYLKTKLNTDYRSEQAALLEYMKESEKKIVIKAGHIIDRIKNQMD